MKHAIAGARSGILEERRGRIEERNHRTDHRIHAPALEFLQQPAAVVEGTQYGRGILLGHADEKPDVDLVNADVQGAFDPGFHLLVGVDTAPGEFRDLGIVALGGERDCCVRRIGPDHLLQHVVRREEILLVADRLEVRLTDQVEEAAHPLGGFVVGADGIEMIMLHARDPADGLEFKIDFGDGLARHGALLLEDPLGTPRASRRTSRS